MANDFSFKDDTAKDDTAKQEKQSKQESASTPAGKKQAYKQPTVKNRDGEDVPFYPASVGHASDSVSRLAVKAQAQAKNREDGGGIPDAAQPLDESKIRYMPMPAGGLHALISQMWPSDLLNQEAFDQHVFDLMTMNRDNLRDDTSYRVGQLVRVPVV